MRCTSCARRCARPGSRSTPPAASADGPRWRASTTSWAGRRWRSTTSMPPGAGGPCRRTCRRSTPASCSGRSGDVGPAAWPVGRRVRVEPPWPRRWSTPIRCGWRRPSATSWATRSSTGRARRGAVGVGRGLLGAAQRGRRRLRPAGAARDAAPACARRSRVAAGLAIADEIARRHGGRLESSPADAAGCRMTLDLPLPVGEVEDQGASLSLHLDGIELDRSAQGGGRRRPAPVDPEGLRWAVRCNRCGGAGEPGAGADRPRGPRARPRRSRPPRTSPAARRRCASASGRSSRSSSRSVRWARACGCGVGPRRAPRAAALCAGGRLRAARGATASKIGAPLGAGSTTAAALEGAGGGRRARGCALGERVGRRRGDRPAAPAIVRAGGVDVLVTAARPRRHRGDTELALEDVEVLAVRAADVAGRPRRRACRGLAAGDSRQSVIALRSRSASELRLLSAEPRRPRAPAHPAGGRRLAVSAAVAPRRANAPQRRRRVGAGACWRYSSCVRISSSSPRPIS